MRRSLLIFVLAAALFPAGAEARALYVTNVVSDNVSRLNIAANGSLGAPVAPFSPLADPVALAFAPDGRALLGVITGAPGAAQGFSVAPSGAATASGASVAAGGSSAGSAVTPNGRFAFVSNSQGGAGNQTISRYSVAANGALTSLGAPTTVTGTINLNQVVVTRDGRFLYVVSNVNPSNVHGFSIGSDGSLTALAGSPFNIGATTGATIALSPDGRFLFVGDPNGLRLVVAAIASNGALSSAAPPAPYGGGAKTPVDIVVSPDGQFVFQANAGHTPGPAVPSLINVFRVGGSGALSEVPGSPFSVSGVLTGLSITPDGRRLFALYQGAADNIDGFSVSSAGALAALPGSPYPSGGSVSTSARQPLAIAPNQGPLSGPLIASRRSGTRTVDFSAAGAGDPDGSVARWVWSFGDGQTASTASPSVSHTYARDGAYVPSVTVVDDEGCSTALVHTGKQALCNGSPAARAVGAVPSFDATGPVISGFKIAKRKRSKSKASFRLSEAASLTAKLERRLPGRRVGKKCRQPSRKNRKRKRCARYRSLGSVKRAGEAGANSLTIGKRFRRRKLRAGSSYRLTLTATDASGNVSKRVRKSFRVPKAKRKKR